MSVKQIYWLTTDEVRNKAIQAVCAAPDGYIVEVRAKTRTLAQNARMWAMLSEVSEKVEWYGKKLEPEEWKDVFTAALKRQDVVPGIEGGFVVLGQRTSKMTVAEMGDLMELISAFCAERGVQLDWTA